MELSKVSKKYLTSVPAGIRKALGLEVGDILAWKVENNKVIIEVIKNPAKALRGKYDDSSLTYESVEEKADELIMQEIGK
ncbi:MAG: AbrB/MazE/SpoVT family DNA-binding domain-containing protein [Thermofilum sp.]|jgi:bifunctional DNA-binding transcriptional regulator/antitoxin component of YhaV-PrlF toxin-antitoxin module|nr:AbrB/MazE/SpoVT family DNA-binding domain-containing protein [Thermofilum sp.]